MNNGKYYPLLAVVSDMVKNTSDREQQKIDFWYKLYFDTKKRKDLRRSAKTRIMKNAEKEWNFWCSLKKHFDSQFIF